MRTSELPDSNDTEAVGAGPRATLSTPYPCSGYHESRYAPAGWHVATTSPPLDVSTVPLGFEDAPVVVGVAVGVAVALGGGDRSGVADADGFDDLDGLAAGRADRDDAGGSDGELSCASLASA
jgi:hypothetical protein